MKITRDSAGEIKLTIPLTITISLGEPISGVETLEREAPQDLEQFSLASLSSTSFRWDAALSCALASKLAYSGADDVESKKSAWGFQSIKFIEAVDTQCFVGVGSDAVLVAFRGTENVADWLADFNALRVDRAYGKVHRGFYHAFNDVRPMLESALAPVRGRPLVITGHSLGGALATVAAAEWCQDNSFKPSAVYTYGQPRVGNGQFSTFMQQQLGSRFSRFVNDDDIVTRVPPGFSHVGKLFHFNSTGDLDESTTESVLDSSEPPALTEAEFDRLRAQLLLERRGESLAGVSEATVSAAEFEGFFPSVSDHRIDNYIERIARRV